MTNPLQIKLIKFYAVGGRSSGWVAFNSDSFCSAGWTAFRFIGLAPGGKLFLFSSSKHEDDPAIVTGYFLVNVTH